MIGTAACTDPARIQFRLANQAGALFDVEVEREGVGDLGVVWHA